MPEFVDDPVKFIADLEEGLEEGDKYLQSPDFDYEGREVEYLEEIYPKEPVTDGKADSWEVAQGQIGNCGTIAHIAALAAGQGDYSVEQNLYPLERSKTGCYLVRFATGTTTAWLPIDSRVPLNSRRKLPAFAKPTGNSHGFWGSLLEKAFATYQGGSYNELTNYAKKGISRPKFYPGIWQKKSTFPEVVEAFRAGAYAIFSWAHQKDEEGNKISVPGIVTGHAFALVDYASVEKDGVAHELVRIENPWGGGSDYKSPYSDDSDFWESDNLEHQALLADSSGAGGNWWMAWDELLSLNKRESMEFLMPLPLPGYQSVEEIEFDFDGTNQTEGRWSGLTQLMAAGYLHEFTLAEDTALMTRVEWGGGTGARHSYFIIADKNTGKQVYRSGYGWWGRSKVSEFNLKAGDYILYPASVDQHSDRGIFKILMMN